MSDLQHGMCFMALLGFILGVLSTMMLVTIVGSLSLGWIWWCGLTGLVLYFGGLLAVSIYDEAPEVLDTDGSSTDEHTLPG